MSLQKIYDDPKLATNNPVLLALRANTNVDEAIQFLEGKTAVQMRRQSHRPSENRMAPAGGPAGHYQADLMMLEDYRGVNNMKRMILTILNTTTRFVYARPIANKKADTVRGAIQSIFDGKYFHGAVVGDGETNLRKTRPLEDMKTLRVDGGTEFMNDLKKYLQDKKINLEVSAPYRHGWLSRTNRFHRTLRQRLGEHFARKNTHRYVDVFQEILDNYNNTPHSTLKKILRTPQDAPASTASRFPASRYSPASITPEDEHKIRQYEMKQLAHTTSNIYVGGYVRLEMSKTKKGEMGKISNKGQQDIWTRDVYKVLKKVGVNSYIVDVPPGEIKLWQGYDLQAVEKPNEKTEQKHRVNVVQARAQRELDRDLGGKEEREKNIIPDIGVPSTRRAVRDRKPSAQAIRNAQR